MILNEYENEQLREKIIEKYGEEPLQEVQIMRGNNVEKDDRTREKVLCEVMGDGVEYKIDNKINEEEYICSECGRNSKFSTYKDSYYMKVHGICFACKRGSDGR